MTEKDEVKPFLFEELKAMCMLCAAHAVQMVSFPNPSKFKNEVEAREWLESKIEEIINLRWNSEDKKADTQGRTSANGEGKK